MFFMNTIINLMETIHDYVIKEMYDEQTIKKKIMELQVLYEIGDVGEEEYQQEEKKLLDQLRKAREYNRKDTEELEEENDVEAEESDGQENIASEENQDE